MLRTLRLALLLLVVACSTPERGTGSGTGTGADTGGDDGGGTSEAPDALAADGTGGTGGTGEPADATQADDPGSFDEVEFDVPADTLRTSYVALYSYSANDIQSGTVVAGFYDQSPVGILSETETVGPCEVRTTIFGGDTGFPKYANGGPITIEGGSETVTLPHGAGGYQAWQSDTALFTGGEALVISNEGSSKVPAFEAHLTAPSHVSVEAPVVFLGQDLEIDKSSDLTFAWSGGTHGSVVISLSGPQQLPEPQTNIRCRFDAVAGEGTIPAELLAKVVLSGAGSVSLDAEASTEVVVDGWGPVSVGARMAGLKASGAQFLESAVFP